MVKAIGFIIAKEDVTLRRNPDGTITGSARYLWHRGRRYTPQGIVDYFNNEIARKGTSSRVRTTSRAYRAGSRRTKKHVHATR